MIGLHAVPNPSPRRHGAGGGPVPMYPAIVLPVMRT
jgi:hypothetical protein